MLQIDSVNVLARSHYLPVFSRLGPYPVALLDQACNAEPRRLVEQWAHMASYTVPRIYPLLRFRMEAAEREAWGGLSEVLGRHRRLPDVVMAHVATHGPATSAQIERGLNGGSVEARRREDWGWNWSEAKVVVEFLFRAGRLASAGRTDAFERLYDLPERVLPPQAPSPDEATACRELIRIAARAHGVATLACLQDYFRLGPAQARRAVGEVVEAGDLVPVQVQGWRRQAYLHREAAVPSRVGGSALLSPFDPLVWFRRRTLDLFGLHYRIEIYTPAAKRVHGYYVLPYLIGDRLAARVDLKADRAGGRLLVQSAWLAEPAARGRLTPAVVADRLAQDLRRMADWLGLGDVVTSGRGDLAGEVGAALRVI